MLIDANIHIIAGSLKKVNNVIFFILTIYIFVINPILEIFAESLKRKQRLFCDSFIG